jgi:4-hydroxybenzoate polyprenyltransferase
MATIGADTKSRTSVARDVLAQLRVHQWVKNILVFVSPLAAHALFDPEVAARSLLVFVAFCAAASGAYVINDLLDLRADRAHPRKRERPLASGRLPLAFCAVGPVLMLIGIGVGFAVSPATAALVAAYVGLTLAYSAYLKVQPLVDIFTLSALYTLRLFAGEVSVGIEHSIWLLSFSGFMFLSLALLKRTSEYQAMVQEGTDYATRRGYTPADIEMLKMMGIAASYVATMVLSLYLSSDHASSEYGRPMVLWLVVPVFLFWQSRMWLSALRGHMTDDPIVFAAGDWVSRLCLGLLVLLYVVASTG